MSTPVALKIDFVSDVSCPWCVVALHGLEQALARVPEVDARIHFQPFELKPGMPAQGQDTVEHIQQKYGTSAEAQAHNRESIRQRGAEVGFTFNRRTRVWNTFDAHRLLHWAGTLGGDAQRALKHALFAAYFTDDQPMSSHDVLVRVAGETGLDAARARQVLEAREFADEVRAQESFYAGHGITAVPSVIVNERHLIQGGQPPEAFEQVLRRIAAQARRQD